MFDHVLIILIMFAAVFLVLGTGFLDDASTMETLLNTLPIILLGLVLYVVKDSYGGISPGKWVFGILIRDSEDHTKVPPSSRLLTRGLYLFFGPVEAIAMVLSPQKKRIADNHLGTVVLKNPVRPPKRPRVMALVSLFVVFFAFTFSFTTLSMKSSKAYKKAIATIEQNDELLQATGGIEGYGFFPTGSITITNDSGEAYFEIEVDGKVQDILVYIGLEKAASEDWAVYRIEWAEN